MNTKVPTKSGKIFIRSDKAHIRRAVFNLKEQEKLISAFYTTVRYKGGSVKHAD
jgi:hypothetical protein